MQATNRTTILHQHVKTILRFNEQRRPQEIAAWPVFGLLALGILGSAPSFEPAAKADELLHQMRLNDARLNKVLLKYDRQSEQTIRPSRFNFQRFGGDPGSKPPDYWEPFTYTSLNHDQLLVYGDHRVLISQYSPMHIVKDKYGRGPSGGLNKIGDFGNVVKEIHDMQLAKEDPSKKTPNYEKQLTIRKYNFELGALHDHLLSIELAHGVGFGKRIEKVSSSRRKGDRTVLSGTIKIWLQDVSTFEIEVDEHGLVRKGRIDCDVGGNKTRFLVSTQGVVRRNGLVLAGRGRFRRGKPPKTEDEKKSGVEIQASREFDVRFTGVETGLTKERFEELSRFDVEPLMQVTDNIKKIRGTGVRLKDGTVGIKKR